MSEKTCCQCGEAKPLDEFYKRATAKDGHMARCKTCHLAYHYRNHEANKAKQRAHYAEHREEIAAYWRRRYEDNPEFFRAKSRRLKAERLTRDPDFVRRDRANWTDDQRWRYGLTTRKNRDLRRARLAGVPSEDIDYEAILAEHGWVCYLCGGEIAKRLWRGRDHLSFDHVIPMRRGGPNIASNIRPAHFGCNARKRSRLLSEITGSGQDQPLPPPALPLTDGKPEQLRLGDHP